MKQKKAKIIETRKLDEITPDKFQLSDSEVEWLTKMTERIDGGNLSCYKVGKYGCEICEKIFPELKTEMERLKTGRLCPCDIINLDDILSRDISELKAGAETLRKSKK